VRRLEQMDHHGEPIIATPMAAAPFRYRDDGRPDWGAMWQGFCELALYGGPPHRGADAALSATRADTGEVVRDAMIDEMIRGIAETTSLWAEPAPGGWLRVTCDSKRMAAWLCATIILENVDARMEDQYLFVPADTGFDLKDQVKSVITVVAKSHHYWRAHLEDENGELSAERLDAKALLLGENITRLQGAA
jgi:sirohydrochlorin cobaltochelatase